MTAWTGENGFAAVPMACYGGVLLMAGFAFAVLERALQAVPGSNAGLRETLESDHRKKLASMAAYAVAVPAALFVHPGVAGAIYVAVAVAWLVPDRRMERAASSGSRGGEA